MWQISVDDLLKLDPPKDIPPHKFNPYELLEPQKINVAENVLVDLSQGEEVKKPEANLEMGSFLDTLTKKEYNVLDLFQNIYVTPQHVQNTDSPIHFSDKLKNENIKTTYKAVESITSLNKLDNIHDFDALIHRTVASFSKINDVPEQKTEECVDSKPKEVDPKKETDIMNSNHFHKTSDFLYRSSTCSIPEKNAYSSYDNAELLKNPSIDTKKAIMAEYKTNESEVIEIDYDYIDYYMSKQPRDNLNVATHENTLIKDTCIYKMINLNKSIDKHLIDPSDHELPVNHSKDLKKPNPLNMMSNNQFTHIKTGQFLKTVVKNEKLHAKQCNLKENNQMLTKGPDIYEKSIVLPQIIERLVARKSILDAQTKMKRRLILDTGVVKPTK